MLGRLTGYLAPHRLTMIGVMATMLGGAGVEILSPWPLKLVVDNVLGGQPLVGRVLDDPERLVLLVVAVLAYLLVAASGGILEVLRERWLTQVSQWASLGMRSDLYAQVQRLSLRFHDRSRVGDLVTRITEDVDALQGAFIEGLSVFSADLLTLLGIVAVMLVVDWQLALVSLIVVPPLIMVVTRFRRRVKQIAREVRSNEGAMAALAQEVLSSIRVVKAFGQEDREHARFVVQARAQVDAEVRAATWQALFSLCVNLVTTLGVALALGYGALRVMRGALTLGEVLVFIQYLNTLYSPLRQFGRLTSVVQTASASAERLNELFEAAPEVPELPAAVMLSRVRGAIAFEDVWFGYDPARPVLYGIDLEIGAGEVVAVIGPTGAGKSSLASLIPRFYDPVRGRVLLDGQDLRTLRLRSLRQQISIVLQEPFLFSGSIFENIAYGRPGASTSEVLEAASAAYADEFIADLPDGYDTPVGERGVTLSGGQRQRIAIARALLMDTPILILDEPTSAIDRDSEAVIMRALRRLIRGRTVIVISHRESATELAERVVVLRHGSIAESGRRATLEAWHAYLARSARVARA